jgi:hypothetical protein
MSEDLEKDMGNRLHTLYKTSMDKVTKMEVVLSYNVLTEDGRESQFCIMPLRKVYAGTGQFHYDSNCVLRLVMHPSSDRSCVIGAWYIFRQRAHVPPAHDANMPSVFTDFVHSGPYDIKVSKCFFSDLVCEYPQPLAQVIVTHMAFRWSRERG